MYDEDYAILALLDRAGLVTQNADRPRRVPQSQRRTRLTDSPNSTATA